MNIQPMNEFLTKDVYANDLAKIIDRIELKYALYILRDTNNCPGEEEAEEIYFLRRVRDILCEVSKS